MLKSASLRLVALYAAGFAAAIAVLGGVTLLTTRAALAQQFDARIRAESLALTREFRTEGLIGVAQAVDERDRTPGALDYGLDAADGRPVAGRLAGTPGVALGWSELRIAKAADKPQTIRLYTTRLANGYRLRVGGDDESVEAVNDLLAERIGLAIGGMAILGLAGGYGLGRGMGRRIAAITGAAEAIIDGDLSRRVPARGPGDDLDHLVATFNRMLDRIQALMESLRQVSSDIAHDLRTPLTRLRARLEARLAHDSGGSDDSIEAALEELDSILATFAALLRIAQIESGGRRARFRPADLSRLARTVVEAFAPSAEDAGVSLNLETSGEAVTDGDPELLTQMIVNLVENGLRHAGRGAVVQVRVTAGPAGPSLSVVDDGPGVPDIERQRLFDRFYRLEASRTTPGHGLGLSLVAAVAKLHGAEASLHNRHPGLEARVRFIGAG
jgi:signal transduction histidine kinase